MRGSGSSFLGTDAQSLRWYYEVPVGQELPPEYESYEPAMPHPDRRAGVLLHPTSLPGPYGIGELGAESRNFVDWLVSAGMQVWQMLPTVPPDSFFSPYSGTCANSGNPLLIAIDELIADGWLDKSDTPPAVPVGSVDYAAVDAVKRPLLAKAASRILTSSSAAEVAAFRKANTWLEPAAEFEIARGLWRDTAWWHWPHDLRFRKRDAMVTFRQKHKAAIDEYIAVQWLFQQQWDRLRTYADRKGVTLVGDMAIYVGGHSADVWANPQLFELDASGAPQEVSGVPPDNFSATGQRWGSPVFRWTAHKEQGYQWWVERVNRALKLTGQIRIDHFRGFAAYWSIPAHEETAMKGRWIRGPGIELFRVLKDKCWPNSPVPLLAEDLGVITPDVVALRLEIGAPGMIIMQEAFKRDNGESVMLPHHHAPNSFAYPGTHDNETALGWWKDSATEKEKAMMIRYIGGDGNDPAGTLIRACFTSVAGTCVFMMQDIMRLDNSHRMNKPGTTTQNWGWRIGDGGVWQRLKGEAAELYKLASDSDRLPPGVKAAAKAAIAAETAGGYARTSGGFVHTSSGSFVKTS